MPILRNLPSGCPPARGQLPGDSKAVESRAVAAVQELCFQPDGAEWSNRELENRYGRLDRIRASVDRPMRGI